MNTQQKAGAKICRQTMRPPPGYQFTRKIYRKNWARVENLWGSKGGALIERRRAIKKKRLTKQNEARKTIRETHFSNLPTQAKQNEWMNFWEFLNSNNLYLLLLLSPLSFNKPIVATSYHFHKAIYLNFNWVPLFAIYIFF